MTSKKDKAIAILDDVLGNFDNPKISLQAIIQKLNRAGKLLEESDLIIWTEIQFGNFDYIVPLKKWIEYYVEYNQEKTSENKKKFDEIQKRIEGLGIKPAITITNEELTVKSYESGGGFNNIGFIENKYNDFVKSKTANDGTYYKSNLLSTISTVKSIAYQKASFYHKKYVFESLPESNFEVLKDKIENSLLDLNLELVELLMLSFKSVSSTKQEEWSQALLSCRRFLEKLADVLYPATDEEINGRKLNKENYINRLWAFMDKQIKSESNREIAKKHVDYIGSYLQNVYRFTNKGIHATTNRFESIKTVMHVYLLTADILGYLTKEQFLNEKPSIYRASLDELEVIGQIPRNIAKEIIRLRINETNITEEMLLKIPGFGEKTLIKIKSNLSLKSE